MNIFVLARKPALCAAYHCDKHVVKMIIEYAQMLSTCQHHFTGSSPLRPTHKNHPCTVWVMKSVHNYNRLAELALELCKEYTKRYKKTHALEVVIVGLQNPPKQLPSSQRRSPFSTVMPEQYIHAGDAVRSYRNYYLGDKKRFAQRRYSKTPRWFI